MLRTHKYAYPQLSAIDFSYFRLSGPGLANCMFIAAQAYVYSIKHNCNYLEPTWPKLSIGPILRRERDIRFYGGLFLPFGVRGIKKLLIIIANKIHLLSNITTYDSLGKHFLELNDYGEQIREYFYKITKKHILEQIPHNLSTVVAIHIRLGDYPPQLRVPFEWLMDIIKKIHLVNPTQEVCIFSDGTDIELKPLLDMRGVTRLSLNSAYTEMLAISKCKLLIASNSTFSAWGAWLGKVPTVFYKRSFPPLYDDGTPEIVMPTSTNLPDWVISLLKK